MSSYFMCTSGTEFFASALTFYFETNQVSSWITSTVQKLTRLFTGRTLPNRRVILYSLAWSDSQLEINRSCKTAEKSKMPAQLSKLAIRDRCTAYSHPWTDSCIDAAAGLGLHAVQDCLRIYSTLYFVGFCYWDLWQVVVTIAVTTICWFFRLRSWQKEGFQHCMTWSELSWALCNPLHFYRGVPLHIPCSSAFSGEFR